MRIAAHQPFAGRKNAIENNWDIDSTTTVFERMDSRMKVAETDMGHRLQERIDDLRELLNAYTSGEVAEDHGKQID